VNKYNLLSLVEELLEGGELFDKIIESKCFNEKRAACIF